MIGVTGSSNRGHGLCCQADYRGPTCNDDENIECSQPAIGIDNSQEFQSVITEEDGLNHQMFAFNTILNQKKCGINNSETEESFKLEAGWNR